MVSETAPSIISKLFFSGPMSQVPGTGDLDRSCASWKTSSWAKNNGNTSQGKWFRSQMKEKHGKAMFKKYVDRDRAESHKWQKAEETERDGGRVVNREGI